MSSMFEVLLGENLLSIWIFDFTKVKIAVVHRQGQVWWRTSMTYFLHLACISASVKMWVPIHSNLKKKKNGNLLRWLNRDKCVFQWHWHYVNIRRLSWIEYRTRHYSTVRKFIQTWTSGELSSWRHTIRYSNRNLVWNQTTSRTLRTSISV